jgi:hypothetical protein
MKKTVYGFLFGFLALFGVATVVPALAQGYDFTDSATEANGFNAGNDEKGVGVAGAGGGSKNANLISTIKKFLNWCLSILGFVALVLCLYGGFMITTAAGDDGKVKKGKTILTQAGIGLAVIALS